MGEYAIIVSLRHILTMIISLMMMIMIHDLNFWWFNCNLLIVSGWKARDEWLK